jgi:hypothetical protein
MWFMIIIIINNNNIIIINIIIINNIIIIISSESCSFRHEPRLIQDLLNSFIIHFLHVSCTSPTDPREMLRHSAIDPMPQIWDFSDQNVLLTGNHRIWSKQMGAAGCSWVVQWTQKQISELL